MKTIGNKKQEAKIDNLVVRCIIEEMGKNPIAFIPIINEILTTKNPDNRIIIKNISDGLTKAAVSQTELINKVKDKIFDMVQITTSDEVVKIVNEQRLSLSSESKKFLENIAKDIITSLCEKYFESKKKEIDEIFSDYFKDIKKYIEIELTKKVKKSKKETEDKDKKNKCNISVPLNLKDEVAQYVSFLQSKK